MPSTAAIDFSSLPGPFFNKVGTEPPKVDVAADKDGIAAHKVDVAAGKDGIAGPKVDAAAIKDGIVAPKVDTSSYKVGIDTQFRSFFLKQIKNISTLIGLALFSPWDRV